MVPAENHRLVGHEVVFRVDDHDAAARLVVTEPFGHQSATLVWPRRAAVRIRGRNEHNGTAVRHGEKLSAQDLGLYARNPARGNRAVGKLGAVAFNLVVEQLDPGRDDQRVVAELLHRTVDGGGDFLSHGVKRLRHTLHDLDAVRA